MTTEPAPAPSDEPSTEPAPARPDRSEAPREPRFTRASAAWVAVAAALLLLILLIIFMLQNSTKVQVEFLAADGRIPLGLALLIAAVTGGVLVAVAGAARIAQLRKSVKRTRRGVGRSRR